MNSPAGSEASSQEGGNRKPGSGTGSGSGTRSPGHADASNASSNPDSHNAHAAVRRRPRSLRGYLARLLLPPLFAMLLVGATGAYFFAIAPATEAYDYGLIDAAHALATRINVANGKFVLDLPAVAEQVVRADKYDKVYFAVRDPGLRLIAGDGGIPQLPRGTEVREGAAFYDAEYEGSNVRVAVYYLPCAPSECSVTVAETTVKRAALQRDVLLGSVLPQSLLAFLTVALLLWGLTRGLEPLEVLSEEIRARSPQDLRPIDLAHEPEEVRPLLRALNTLFEEVAEANRTQQRFLENAAHQLRTPLAVLRTHSEIALALDVSEACRAELEQIHLGTMRAARLANQLLALARAEGGAHSAQAFGPVDLKQVVEEGANDWVHEALRRGIDLGFDLQPATIRGDALLVREALANLVLNALEYTPHGGRVTVRSGTRTGSESRKEAIVQVEDDGPGIPPVERDRVLERFYRVRGTAGVGSGLGLAIVREIMSMHDGGIEIGDGPLPDCPDKGRPGISRGCCVILSFPAIG